MVEGVPERIKNIPVFPARRRYHTYVLIKVQHGCGLYLLACAGHFPEPHPLARAIGTIGTTHEVHTRPFHRIPGEGGPKRLLGPVPRL